MNANEDENNDLPADDFEGTPEEQMRFEIEMLKLKISAELGGQVSPVGDDNDLPADVEKQFLEQILAFHKNRGETTTLGAYLGNPHFPPAENLSQEELQQEWEKLGVLLEKHEVAVNFIADYPLALRYTFITGELLDEDYESYGEGFTTNYIYEEFHPNLEQEQQDATERFMREFFSGEFSEIMLSNPLVSKSGATKTPAEVQELLNRFHNLFPTIAGEEFTVEETGFQSDEEVKGENPRLGFVRGSVRYTATTAEGEAQEIEGPFHLFMQHHWDMWEVVNFYLHGFSWK